MVRIESYNKLELRYQACNRTLLLFIHNIHNIFFFIDYFLYVTSIFDCTIIIFSFKEFAWIYLSIHIIKIH